MPKNLIYGTVLVVAIVVSFMAGYSLATSKARIAVLCGPYSDNFEPALAEIAAAKAKLAKGDTNVTKELDVVEGQLRRAKAWSEKFMSPSSKSGSAP